jgi:hypothetical protein
MQPLLQAIYPHGDFNHQSAYQYLETSKAVEELQKNLCAEMCSFLQFQVLPCCLASWLAAPCKQDAIAGCVLLMVPWTIRALQEGPSLACRLQVVLWKNCLNSLQGAMSESATCACPCMQYPRSPHWSLTFSMYKSCMSLCLGTAPALTLVRPASAAFCRCSPEYNLDLVHLVGIAGARKHHEAWLRSK